MMQTSGEPLTSANLWVHPALAVSGQQHSHVCGCFICWLHRGDRFADLLQWFLYSTASTGSWARDCSQMWLCIIRAVVRRAMVSLSSVCCAL